MNPSGISAPVSCEAPEKPDLSGLVRPGMVWCLDTLDALDAPLHPAEKPGTERMAPVRLREYIAGRTAARRALRELRGHSHAAVLRNEDRTPAWPPGVCGSISHSRHYAICVVARLDNYRAVGVDIEEDSRLKETLWKSVMTGKEQAFLSNLPSQLGQLAATLRFSVKEAYYKCLCGLPGKPGSMLEPPHIETAIDDIAGTFHGAVPTCPELPMISGCFTHFDRHWIALCQLPKS